MIPLRSTLLAAALCCAELPAQLFGYRYENCVFADRVHVDQIVWNGRPALLLVWSDSYAQPFVGFYNPDLTHGHVDIWLHVEGYLVQDTRDCAKGAMYGFSPYHELLQPTQLHYASHWPGPLRHSGDPLTWLDQYAFSYCDVAGWGSPGCKRGTCTAPDIWGPELIAMVVTPLIAPR